MCDIRATGLYENKYVFASKQLLIALGPSQAGLSHPPHRSPQQETVMAHHANMIVHQEQTCKKTYQYLNPAKIQKSKAESSESCLRKAKQDSCTLHKSNPAFEIFSMETPFSIHRTDKVASHDRHTDMSIDCIDILTLDMEKNSVYPRHGQEL